MTDPAFVANLEHELRAPLAVVSGYADLLRLRGDDARLRDEAAHAIGEAATRLAEAVDDLLTVFALDSEALAVALEPLDLRTVVEGTVASLRGRVTAHELVVSLSPEIDGVAVLADADQLPRALRGLLVNACRYSPEGGEVLVAVARRGDLAVISVSDSGVGMDADELAVALERVPYSGAVVRRTGLELYKVRRLVELQHGVVEAESSPGRGSTFSIVAPLAP